LRKVEKASVSGKALDDLKSHIARLEHLKFVLTGVIDQGYIDFSNFEMISGQIPTGGESRCGELSREKPQFLKP
jgi:hypothetical protein